MKRLLLFMPLAAALPFLMACPGGPEHRWVDGLSYTDSCEVQLCWREGDTQTCKLCSDLAGALADGVFEDGSGPRSCEPGDLPSHAVAEPTPTTQCGVGADADASGDEGVFDVDVADIELGPDLTPEVDGDDTTQDAELDEATDEATPETVVDQGSEAETMVEIDATPDCSHLDDNCTEGSWDGESCVAMNLVDGTTCNDGDECTVADACSAGGCAGVQKDCSIVEDQCNEASCIPSSGLCVKVPVEDGTSCNDGDACSPTDSCQVGTCIAGQDLPQGQLDTVGALSVDVVSSMAYIADQTDGVALVDVSNAAQPILQSWAQDVPSALDVVSDGVNVFSVGFEGLRVNALDGNSLGKAPTASGLRLTLANSKAYISATSVFGSTPLLRVVDVAVPSSPVELGTFVPGSGMSQSGIDLDVEGSHAYVATGVDGLMVIDVSDPTTPTHTTTLTPSLLSGAGDGSYESIEIRDGTMYVVGNHNKLSVFDLKASPTNPTFLGDAQLVSNGLHVRISDGLAFVAASTAGFQIFDVTQPSLPQVIATYNTPGAALAAWPAGSYAYLCDGSSFLSIPIPCL